MRKLKSMLFTAGIAAVLAVGVGATVATTGRDVIKADAAATDPANLTFEVNVTNLELTNSYSSPKLDIASSEDSGKKVHITGSNVGTWDSQSIQFKKKGAGYLTFAGPTNYVVSSITPVFTGGGFNYEGSTDGKTFNNIAFADINAQQSFKAIKVKSNSSTTYVTKIGLTFSKVDPNAKTVSLPSFVNSLKDGTAKLTATSTNLTAAKFEWSIKSGAEFVSITPNGDELNIKGVAAGVATVALKVTDGTFVKNLESEIRVYEPTTVADAKAKPDNTVVTVRAYVTLINGGLTYFADKDGTGLQAYGLKGKTFAIGDEIIITGKIATRSGHANQQISGEVLFNLSSGNNVAYKHVNPETITVDMISDTIRLDDLVFVSKDAKAGTMSFKKLRKPADKLFDKAPLKAEKVVFNAKDYVINGHNLVAEKAYDILTVIGENNKDAVIKIEQATKFNEDKVATWLEYIINEDKVGQCKTKFAVAKEMYMALTEAEKKVISEASDDVTLNIKHRYETWASVLGENAYSIGSATNNVMTMNNSIMITVIVVITAIAVTAISVLMIARRKKATR